MQKEETRGTNEKQLEENFTTNEFDWQQLRTEPAVEATFLRSQDGNRFRTILKAKFRPFRGDSKVTSN